MRYLFIAFWMLLASTTSAMAQVSVGIGIALPGVSIGINQPVFPDLVRVPGYPVYYAPQVDSNYFFYDGMYWVLLGNSWYMSSWYNGPWTLVVPESVPLFILRIPVRYYRAPPVYFHGWRPEAPPRWGEHWGHEWEQRRPGWDRWNRKAVPAPAPVPIYQRPYSGDRYPHAEQQPTLHGQNYRYQPRDPVVRQHLPEQVAPKAPAPSPYKPQGDASSQPAHQPSPQGRQRAPAPTPYIPQGDASSQPAYQPSHQGRGKDREKGEERGDERGKERGQDRNR